MNVAARVDADAVVFPNGFTRCEKLITPKAVYGTNVPIASVGLHVARLTCSTHGSIVSRGAVVRKSAKGFVSKAMSEPFALERLPLCVFPQIAGYGGAVL
jgi:hypothetical protein